MMQAVMGLVGITLALLCVVPIQIGDELVKPPPAVFMASLVLSIFP